MTAFTVRIGSRSIVSMLWLAGKSFILMADFWRGVGACGGSMVPREFSSNTSKAVGNQGAILEPVDHKKDLYGFV